MQQALRAYCPSIYTLCLGLTERETFVGALELLMVTWSSYNKILLLFQSPKSLGLSSQTLARENVLRKSREGTRPMKNGRTYLFQIDPTWQRCKHRKDIQFGQTLVAGARQALLGTRASATRAQVPLSSAKLVDYGILHSIGKIVGTRTHKVFYTEKVSKHSSNTQVRLVSFSAKQTLSMQSYVIIT